MKHKVTVLGPLPPPYGGVSLHIVRFCQLLESEGVHAVAVPYTGTTRPDRGGKMAQALRMLAAVYLRADTGRGGILHVHYGGLGYFLAIGPLLMASRARKVITFHSVRVLQDLDGLPAWARKWICHLLNDFALFIPVREEIGDKLRARGLTRPSITVMPAFLPPSPAECDMDRLPTDVVTALEAGRQAGRIQLCCAAYYLGPGYGHDDIYGIEELVSSLAQISSESAAKFDLWVLVSNAPQSSAQLRAESAVLSAASSSPQLGLHLHYGLPLVPVLARCSAFLRPSREDGDSVAVREALAFGLPVLASDVVSRPASVVLYARRDELAKALKPFLAALEPMCAGTRREVLPNNSGPYRAFVESVLGEQLPR